MTIFKSSYIEFASRKNECNLQSFGSTDVKESVVRTNNEPWLWQLGTIGMKSNADFSKAELK